MILEAIVKAIEESDESRYIISCSTGIDQTVLHRIVELENRPKRRKGR